MVTKYINILVGIPTSGKTTWAYYQQEIYGGVVIISRDDVRDSLAYIQQKKYVQNKYNENQVTTIFNNRLTVAVARELDIILDNCHCKESYIDEWIKMKPNGYTLRIIFFDCPLWKAHIRNVLRYLKTGKWIPIKVIKNMKKNYDKIDRKKYEHLLY